MTRLWRAVALLACAFVLACNEETSATASFVGIQGATDLVLVNDLVFVTATDTNELRALNLTPAEGKIVDWVRAPNPLHPLSIPVVDRPIELEGDVAWSNGQPGSGSYVYARAASGRQVSIVDASREVLKQVATIDTLGTKSGEIQEEITAIAAKGTAGGSSTLFLATYDGARSQIWSVQIPKSGSPADDYPSTLNDTIATPVGDEEPCGAILSLLILPGDDLAYSVRRTPALGTSCGPTTEPEIAALRAETSVLLNVADGTRTQLDFGTPMRRLFTNPAYASFPAANRIYGIIDEGSCGFAERCRGVLAVEGPSYAAGAVPELDTPADPTNRPCSGGVGKIACDAAGLPMAPIQSENALVMAAAVGSVDLSGNIADDAEVPGHPARLTGISTRSDGTLQIWDAENLIDYDVNTVPAAAESIYMVDAAGTPTPLVRGLVDRDGKGNIAVQLGNGAARNELIRVRHGGTLPDFTGQPAPAGTTITPPVSPVGEVEVGDVVVGTGTCDATGATVTAVTATSIELDEALASAPGCSYSISPPVASDGTSAWIISGTRSGFLGRFTAPAAGATATFRFPSEPARLDALYFFHPLGVTELPPLVTFDFTGTDPSKLPIGTTYVITSRSNFQRAIVAMSQTRWSQFTFSSNIAAARVAGSIVFRPGTTEAVVSYPSDNGVVLFDAVKLKPLELLTEFTPYF